MNKPIRISQGSCKVYIQCLLLPCTGTKLKRMIVKVRVKPIMGDTVISETKTF